MVLFLPKTNPNILQRYKKNLSLCKFYKFNAPNSDKNHKLKLTKPLT